MDMGECNWCTRTYYIISFKHLVHKEKSFIIISYQLMKFNSTSILTRIKLVLMLIISIFLFLIKYIPTFEYTSTYLHMYAYIFYTFIATQNTKIQTFIFYSSSHRLKTMILDGLVVVVV